MTFSYQVEDHVLLKDVDLPLESGSFVLLNGVENQAFGLIGGIVAGLFPIDGGEQIPHLEELVKVFKGSLNVSEGSLPVRAVYLGPDPEKHLLFSRVDEEILAQLGSDIDAAAVLSLFRLKKGFLERRISSLSGGEKMKLALAIAFFKDATCTVLHGIVPWLDENGKACLIREISRAQDDNRCVLVMEQEIDDLLPHADRHLFFDGRTLKPPEEKTLHRLGGKIVEVSRILGELVTSGHRPEPVVSFRDVEFSYEGYRDGGFRLSNLSFVLESSRVYGLIGNNGAGKSTIANLILRLEQPSGGTISLFGKPLESICRKDLMEGVCYVSQFPEQHITLSNVQQYRSRAETKGNFLSKKLLDIYFESEREYPISQLTPLQMKALSLISFVTDRTGLIIIDEPTWGIDPEGLARFFEFLTQAVQALDGVTILIITHDLALVELLSAEVMRMKNGVLVTEEKPVVRKKMGAGN